MIKSFLLLGFAALLYLPSSAQITYEPEEFDGISVTGNLNVILQKGEVDKVVVDAHGIPESEVTVKVSRGVLRLKLINSIFYKDDEVDVTVTYRNLRTLKGHAGARIEADHAITGDQIYIRSTSGARVHLEVAVNTIDGGATEGGMLELTGTTEMQDASAATGGQYQAFGLECARSYVRANTGGRAEVVANDRLEASANTGGTIEYKGNPEETTIKTIIAGNVHKAGW